MKLKIEFYEDASGDWRWRALRSGQIVADSAEGYVNRADMEQTLTNFLDSIAEGDLELPDDFTWPAS